MQPRERGVHMYGCLRLGGLNLGWLCVVLACSSPVTTALPLPVDGASTADGGADVGAAANDGGDAGAAADATADAAAVVADSADALGNSADALNDGATNGMDAASSADTAPDLGQGDAADAAFFDPSDAGAIDGGTPPAPLGLGSLYAHTSSDLYRLDSGGFVKVGTFQFDSHPGSMTDIAINKDGLLYGVTFDDLFACDKVTVKCSWLAALPSSFNGLTFVPKGTVSATDETLIGIGTDGSWNAITVQAASASIKKLGSYGNGLASSGDAFSIEGVGTFATTKAQFQFGGTDKLAQVNPINGATIVIGDTGVSELWGFAWQAGKFYGFSSSGSVYEIDVATGKAKFASFAVPGGLSWWGAGVSTRANGPQ